MKDGIVHDDFAKVDMRVGTIIAVEPFPRARNPSYKVQVNFGPFGARWSSARITNYRMDDLVGRQVVCVVNMPPRNIAGFQSEILILGVPDEEGKVILLAPASPVRVGGAVF